MSGPGWQELAIKIKMTFRVKSLTPKSALCLTDPNHVLYKNSTFTTVLERVLASTKADRPDSMIRRAVLVWHGVHTVIPVVGKLSQGFASLSPAEVI